MEEQNRTEQKKTTKNTKNSVCSEQKTEQNKSKMVLFVNGTEQNRTEQIRTEQNRTEQIE
jgi:hypothetical protein